VDEPFDRLLLAPGDADLADALEQATQRGGGDAVSRAQWRPLLAEVAGRAEGRSQIEQLRGARYVSVAWWTDHQGRKHVRVAGGDWHDPGWHPHHSRLDQDLRPPLWHVSRERTFRVTRPGQPPVWVVSCACGATGAPAALAWMGPRCGPCHDRVEEGQPHPGERDAALFALGSRTIYAVAFAPDSRRLAVASEFRCVDLLWLDGRPEQRLFGDQDAGEDDEFRTLVFSHDGQFLVAGDPDEWVVRVWDLDGGTDEQELYIEKANDSEVLALGFSPLGRLLTACTRDGVVSAWRLQDSRAWQHVRSTRWYATALAFAPDGQLLAVGRRHGVVDLHDPSTWKRRRRLETQCRPVEDILFVHFAANRLVVVTGCQEPELALSLGCQLRLLNLARGHEERSADFSFVIAAIAATPDGRYLAWVVHDEQHSPGEVTFWDVERWHEVGRLEWGPEDSVLALDFSPDGQTLVTGSSAGVVKLWPWHLLLKG
jgi:hypothetical protein